MRWARRNLKKRLHDVFEFEGARVTVVVDGGGKVWFKTPDLRRALRMEEHVSRKLHRAIDETHYKSYAELFRDLAPDEYLDIHGVHSRTKFIDETGAVLWIDRSRQPMSGILSAWVREYVLPSVRLSSRF